jgi:hypothetical protein
MMIFAGDSMVRTRLMLPVLVLAVTALAGCDGDDSDLPEIGSSPGASQSAGADGEQAVKDRVALYETTLDGIAGGQKLDMKRLRAVAVDDWAQTVGQNLQQTKAQGFVVKGEVLRTFESVDVVGESAAYVECVDQRQTRLVKNGKPGPQVTDPPALSTISFVKQSGEWKVKDVKAGGTC